MLDHYLCLPFNDWPAKWDNRVKDRLAGGKVALALVKEKTADVGPSQPLERYATTCRDPWYGEVVVGQRDGGLWINFASTPRMEGKLVHHQYNTFRTEFTDPSLEPALVTFRLVLK